MKIRSKILDEREKGLLSLFARKKAVSGNFIRILIWVIVFAILFAAVVYFLIKKLTAI